MSDATILVKKADGTSVRMTLDEFQAYRAGGQASKPASQQAVKQPAKATEKAKNAVQWSKDDHKSPLDASLHAESISPKVPSAAVVDERVETLMKNVEAEVPAHLRGRLQSLLQSRLKDIRSDDQLREYLTRSENSGGLGMPEASATAIVRLVSAIAPKKSVMPTKKSVMSETAAVLPAPKPEQKTAVPVLTQVTPAKSLMHDVVAITPPAQESLGPIDEIRLLSVEEFRRLGATVEERKMRLLAKFQTIQSESYLFYQEAADAWRESPLYRMYQDVVVRALQNKQTVDAVVQADGKGMKADEIKAIIEVNQSLL